MNIEYQKQLKKHCQYLDLINKKDNKMYIKK